MASDTIKTESIISKLGVINFPVVKLHVVHSSVQVPTWWWHESPRGLIFTEGLCIGFRYIVIHLGYLYVNSFAVCTTLGFAHGFD